MACLLLHGWGVSNTLWQDFADRLTGFNQIAMPCLYKISEEAKDNQFESIAATLSEKLNSNSVVIAWSIGGLIAAHMAKLTDKVKAIIFIASTPCFVNKENWLNAIDKKNIEALKNNLRRDTNSTLEYFSGLIAHGDASVKQTNETIRNHLAENKNKAVLATWLDQMQKTDQRNKWAEIKLPLQMILGGNDSLINLKTEFQIKELNPNIEVQVIKNCGHAPFLSKQQDTIKIINNFIDAKFN